MDKIFAKFAAAVGNAHMQLTEGAITYEEFFNFCMARGFEVGDTPEYQALHTVVIPEVKE
jgi:hypothetical protein